MSDRGVSQPLQSRTYHDASTHMDDHVRGQVFAHYLSLIDSMSKNLEAEIEQQAKSQNRPVGEIVGEIIKGGDMAQLRALTGRMRHDVGYNLGRWGERWNVPWEEPVEQSVSRDVKFSMDIIHESVLRMYGKDVQEFEARWAAIDRKKHLGSTSPLNIPAFSKVVYHSQLSNQIPVALQNMMFMQLEHEFLQSLGMLLFHLNNYLNERGIRSTEVRTAEDNSQVERYPQAVNDETLFNTLCDLLQTWEPKAFSLDESVPERPLTNTEIMATISTLQQWVPKVLEDALGQPDGRLAAQIKETMIKQAEALGVPEGKAKISDDDSQAVDMVDEVFTQSLYERKIQAAARTVMAQILFPSVKAAILNRRWFSDDNHPARKFVYSVTDALAPQAGDVEQDMMIKATETVDKLVSGFNEDVSIFEVLAQEIQEYIDQKKRAREAGFDTQAAAKIIRGELEKLWSTWTGPSPSKDFAIDLGTEYLVSLEKVGERNSPKWKSALSILQQFLYLRSSIQSRVKIDGLLRDGLMKMLMACGWTGVRAHTRLAEQEDVIHAYYVLGQTKFHVQKPSSMQDILAQELNQSTDTNLTQRIEVERERAEDKRVENKRTEDAPNSPAAVGEQPASEQNPLAIPADQPAAQPNSEIGQLENPVLIQPDVMQEQEASRAPTVQQSEPAARAIHSAPLVAAPTPATPAAYNNDILLEKIMALAIDSMSTWINSQGETVVVKLSFISPISMKFLFVNKNGARVLVGTPKELADMANKGRFFPGVTP